MRRVAGAAGRSRQWSSRRHIGATARAAGAAGEQRVAQDGDAVRVHYEGRLEDGTVFDTSRKRGSPLTFSLGAQQVVPGFEKAVLGLSEGEKVTVTIPPEEAYGERNEEYVLSVPAKFVPEGVEVGMRVGLGEGQQVQATITEICEDGSVKVDANPPLAGKTLTFDIELVGFRELLAPETAPEGLELATFAAGCFWGVELAFQRVPGVVSTSVGYAQGEKEQPTYEEVCQATTGHTEAVRVVFDPSEVSFGTLLDTFWERVGKNATTLNVAGNDEGPQYRSGIYFHSEEQQQIAEKSRAELQTKLGEDVVTEVEEAKPFWNAEDSHQQYLEKGGVAGSPQSAEKGCTDTIRCYG